MSWFDRFRRKPDISIRVHVDRLEHPEIEVDATPALLDRIDRHYRDQGEGFVPKTGDSDRVWQYLWDMVLGDRIGGRRPVRSPTACITVAPIEGKENDPTCTFQYNRAFIEQIETFYRERGREFLPATKDDQKVITYIYDCVCDRLVRQYMDEQTEEPFVCVRMRLAADLRPEIDTLFNQHFIRFVDRQYRSTVRQYNPDAPDGAKIAVYLFDIFSDLAEPYLPETDPQPTDPAESIPRLAVRGGEAVKQVVDLDRIRPEDRIPVSGYEFMG